MRGCKQKQAHNASHTKVILHYYCVCFNCTCLYSECSLCSTAWSQWFGELEELLRAAAGKVWIPERLLQGLETATRFGDCCKVSKEASTPKAAIFQVSNTWRLRKGLDTWKIAALGVEASEAHPVRVHFGNQSTNAHISSNCLYTKYQFINCCVYLSWPNTQWVCFKPRRQKAEVFQTVQ